MVLGIGSSTAASDNDKSGGNCKLSAPACAAAPIIGGGTCAGGRRGTLGRGRCGSGGGAGAGGTRTGAATGAKRTVGT